VVVEIEFEVVSLDEYQPAWRGLTEREQNLKGGRVSVSFPPSRDPLILLHAGRPGERRTHESLSLAVRLVRNGPG
jgi:hypothetical protein